MSRRDREAYSLAAGLALGNVQREERFAFRSQLIYKSVVFRRDSDCGEFQRFARSVGSSEHSKIVQSHETRFTHSQKTNGILNNPRTCRWGRKALGMVTLGTGASHEAAGLGDLRIAQRLHRALSGGREQPAENARLSSLFFKISQRDKTKRRLVFLL